MAYNDRYDRDSRYMERDRDYGRRNESRGLFRGGDDDRDYSSRGYGDGDRGSSRMSDRSSGYGSERDRRFGPDADRRGLPMDETRSLIASNKVEGTPVYGRDGDRLGSIRNLMIDKYSGEVRYAVLSHSTGFLGLNESYLPIDWDELRYDERQDGYRIDMTEDQLRQRIDRQHDQRGRSSYGMSGDRERSRSW
jgi:sporulation protein YlmC with PRC-barrel domain